jgi:hypothetical protein
LSVAGIFGSLLFVAGGALAHYFREFGNDVGAGLEGVSNSVGYLVEWTNTTLHLCTEIGNQVDVVLNESDLLRTELRNAGASNDTLSSLDIFDTSMQAVTASTADVNSSISVLYPQLRDAHDSMIGFSEK